MRRVISLIMIAALLSVTGVPMLPKAAVCHAAEANADCDSCHTEADGSHPMAGHDMATHTMHSATGHMDHGHQMQMHKPGKVEQAENQHSHHKQLSAAEKECRIECGCGCNHSVDGFPHLLAPHVASVIQFETFEQLTRVEPATTPALEALSLTSPPPPPKQI